MRRAIAILRVVAFALGWFALAVTQFFTALAIHFAQWPGSATLRSVLAILYLLAIVVLLVTMRPLARAAGLSLVPPLIVSLLYGLIQPKTDGVYPPETSRAPTVDRDGDRFTIHGVRNFDYRTETDFDARWDDRTYDLSQVRTVDIFYSYWTEGEEIAHTMLSFGFADGRYLAASIEVRREADEVYGPLDGEFRRYELIYIWADERDVIRLRTNYRKEDVYLYRTTCTPESARLLLDDYLRETEAIARQPVFYNTLTRNCTSSIVTHVNRVLTKKIPWYQRRLRNGIGDRRSHEHGWIAGSGEFATLRKNAYIDELGQAADKDPDFSQRIRARLPR